MDAKEFETHLVAAVGGKGPQESRWASGLRLRARLVPVAGDGAKLMPPTYLGEKDSVPKGQTPDPVYMKEDRKIDGNVRPCVSLDSVASQANRMEAALHEQVRCGAMQIPEILVDQAEFGKNSALLFSHRCFDAWAEEAQLDGKSFASTPAYGALASVISRRHATPLMEMFPVALLLGGWASRNSNPKGSTRVARALTSEIIAVDAIAGARASSKVDLHDVSNAIKVFESRLPGQRMTTDREQAVQVKGEPKLYGKEGKPSEAGYGNVAPQLAKHGGITCDYALHLATLSFPAMRECGFPDPQREDKRRPARDLAGRMMLVALALRLLALGAESGYDLRSGCLLSPEAEIEIEVVGRLARSVATCSLVELDTAGLLTRAVRKGAKQGLHWNAEPIRLKASAEQLALLTRSNPALAAEAM